MPGLIDEFMPDSDVAERHEIVVNAPADLVFAAAREVDLRSNPLARAIFRMREVFMGATGATIDRPRGIVAETMSLGWGLLAERPHRELVMGAVTQPWLADVKFRAVEPDRFRAFAEPDLVKIAWTLEAEPIDAGRSRFRTQTRVLATDDEARRKFRRYWRWAGYGIVLIRWLILPAVRRKAERRYRGSRS